jgi:predicted nucleic acid-binding protein
VILVDNTVLSNFARTSHLSLLRSFCNNEGLTPQAVQDEFQVGIDQGLFLETGLSWLKLVEMTNPQEIQLSQLYQRDLGKGESECLAIAICRKYALLTDDHKARLFGFREKVRISGSIGVLVSLVTKSAISLPDGNQVLREFIDAGYFSPFSALDGLF